MPILTRKEALDLCRLTWYNISHLYNDSNPEIILFGSYAREDAEEGSDLDMMILLDESRERIADTRGIMAPILGNMLTDTGVLISPIIENKEYFHHWLPAVVFYQNIYREGVHVYS